MIKQIILALTLVGASWGQICGSNGKLVPNLFTGKLECTAKTGAAGYPADFAAATGLTVTAATHGQGTKPTGECWDDASPHNKIIQTDGFPTVSSTGTIVFAWTGSKTGYCLISALGGTGATGPVGATGPAGAAGSTGARP